MSETTDGGCACGAVRYALLTEPYDCGWCHCTLCRNVSGAPAMVFATVPADDYRVVKGADRLGLFRSTGFGERQYCTACGTPLTMKVDHQPESIDLTVASLDDPQRIAPEFHIFYGSKIGWFEPGDDLPKHAKFRPGTRGLEGVDPPE